MLRGAATCRRLPQNGRGVIGSWLARKDSNLQSPDPESGALPFGHSPAALRDFTPAPSFGRGCPPVSLPEPSAEEDELPPGDHEHDAEGFAQPEGGRAPAPELSADDRARDHRADPDRQRWGQGR